jgi:electron transport complex protein RnfB
MNDERGSAVTGAAVHTGIDAARSVPDAAQVRAIDALLPQTQCRQCGYTGCLPYARALAQDEAPINRCPPGGDAGIALLAQHLGRPLIALDASCGSHRALHVAVIDESRCIGCTLCIHACPVDAIAGAVKRMHSVLPDACTGCDLCLPPCPMDCIRMVPVEPVRAWTRADADRARDRLHARDARRIREKAEDEERLAAKAQRKLDALDTPAGLDPAEVTRRRAIIEQALARVRQRRAAAQAALPGGDPA